MENSLFKVTLFHSNVLISVSPEKVRKTKVFQSFLGG